MFSDAQDEVALVCSLTPAELEVRGGEISLMASHVRAIEETHDGYRFAFPAEAEGIPDLLAFILAERACCPFFTFELTFPSPHKDIWLTIRGHEGVKPLVYDSFVSRFTGQTNAPTGAASMDE